MNEISIYPYMFQGQDKFKENQDKIETWPTRGICSITQLASVIQPNLLYKLAWEMILQK